jgi:hypothetical protein
MTGCEARKSPLPLAQNRCGLAVMVLLKPGPASKSGTPSLKSTFNPVLPANPSTFYRFQLMWARKQSIVENSTPRWKARKKPPDGFCNPTRDHSVEEAFNLPGLSSFREERAQDFPIPAALSTLSQRHINSEVCRGTA